MSDLASAKHTYSLGNDLSEDDNHDRRSNNCGKAAAKNVIQENGQGLVNNLVGWVSFGPEYTHSLAAAHVDRRRCKQSNHSQRCRGEERREPNGDRDRGDGAPW